MTDRRFASAQMAYDQQEPPEYYADPACDCCEDGTEDDGQECLCICHAEPDALDCCERRFR